MDEQIQTVRFSDHDKKVLFEDTLHRGIKDRYKFDKAMRLFLDVSIPNHVVSPGHCSPFDFMSDAFFDVVDKMLVLANRTGGKTYDISVLNVMDALFKPGIEITSAGAVVEQATRSFTYSSGLCRKELIAPLVSRIRTQPYLIEFTNGSSIRVITASEDGFNGPHPNRSNVDEVDLIGWRDLQEAFSMTKSSDLHSAQDRLLSTIKTMTGTMARLLKEIKDRGFKKYKWSIFEVLEQCTLECSTCPIFDKCLGRAKQSGGGYYKIKDFISKVAMLDTNTFQRQWLCDEEVVEGAFYAINKSKHFWTVQQFCNFYRIQYDETKTIEELVPAEWRKLIGQDFGFNDPTVYIAFALAPDNRLIAYKEFYQRGLIASDSALCFIGKKEINGTKAFDWRTQILKPHDMLLPDPSGKNYVEEIISANKSHPIKDGWTLPYCRAINNQEFGYNAVRTMIEKEIGGFPRLVFLETCPNAQDEHVLLQKSKSSMSNATELPALGSSDHAVDPTRYVCAQVSFEEKNKEVESQENSYYISS